MKRLLSVLLVVAVFCITLCSCKENPGPAQSSDSSAVSEITSSESTPEVKPLEYKPAEGSFKIGDTLNGQNGKIQNLTYVTEANKTYKKIELKAALSGLPAGINVYDAKELDYSITLTSQSGKTITLPGFYYEGYIFNEALEVTGKDSTPGDFRFRISLTEATSWDFVITLKVNGEQVDTLSGYINVEKGEDERGYLSVEKKRKQSFVFDDGTRYIAIGENVASANNEYATGFTRGAKMIEWMKGCAQYGSNFTRIWLTPWFLGINKGPAPNDFTGGLCDAAQLDKMFDAWEELDMYGQVCMFSFNQLMHNPESAESGWSTFCYNKNAGGYLEKPEEFFTNERAIEDTKTYFRYLIARYGYSTKVMAWEFFNEVDLTTGYAENFENAVKWHEDMAAYIRSIDPYNHMLTTSTASRHDVINNHRVFDFASLHWYNYTTLAEVAKFQQEFWYLNQRPTMMGEIGIMSARIDEDLVTFHQQNWTGVMGGGSGTGLTWYWDDLDNVGGYWDFQVISEMADHIPWDRDDMFLVSTNNVNPSDETVQVMGYRGNDFAYLWLYDTEFTQITKSVKDIKDCKFSVKLKSGKYHVRWINTWTGVSISQTVEEAVDGVLQLTAPTWQKDVAVAITVD